MNHKTNPTLLTIILNLILFAKCEECLNLNIQLSQKIENEGLHREASWMLEMNQPPIEEWLQNECQLMLFVNMSKGLYVNKDEVLDWNHIREAEIRVDGDVNIESITHESTEHAAYIYLDSGKVQKITFSMPFHLRYQRAQINGKFGKVPFKRPSVLARCETEVCSQNQLVASPCDYSSGDICIWHNVSYQALFEDAELFVPIGDLDDYPLVAIVTLLLGCAGCIYILSLLSTAPK